VVNTRSELTFGLPDTAAAAEWRVSDTLVGYLEAVAFMEALEIAAYSLLEQLAMRCGDQSTADAARRNRADEEEMARKIAATWGAAIDMTLEQEGIAA